MLHMTADAHVFFVPLMCCPPELLHVAADGYLHFVPLMCWPLEFPHISVDAYVYVCLADNDDDGGDDADVHDHGGEGSRGRSD
eukprot:6428824-Karenia_brevis.AAC.1